MENKVLQKERGSMLKMLLIMMIPLLVATYTISFGMYNWRSGNKLGAIGVYFLASCSVLVPFLVILMKNV
jgi:hypothetical protein